MHCIYVHDTEFTRQNCVQKRFTTHCDNDCSTFSDLFGSTYSSTLTFHAVSRGSKNESSELNVRPMETQTIQR